MNPKPRVDEHARDQQALALDAARTLARAIGESEVFRRYEAAQDAFMRDEQARSRFQTYQVREQELQLAAMWGGAQPDDHHALQREWLEVSALPTLRAYLEAREAVRLLFREVTGRITDDIGVDYGAACSPAGGCC